MLLILLQISDKATFQTLNVVLSVITIAIAIAGYWLTSRAKPVDRYQ